MTNDLENQLFTLKINFCENGHIELYRNDWKVVSIITFYVFWINND